MNAGTDYQKAKRQAQANANRSGVAWRMFMYNGVWWVERCQWSDVDPKENPQIEIIKPESTQ